MKTTEEIAKPLLKALNEWSKENPKLVVAIDGHIGAGKTTLLNYIAQHNPDVLAIPKDDFLSNRKERIALMKDTEDKVSAMESGGYDYERLRKVVELFRKDSPPQEFLAHDKVSGEITEKRTYDFKHPILVTEGVLMFHPKHEDSLWDKRVYLVSDTKAAAERREKRDVAAFAKHGRKIPPRKDPNSLAYTFEKVLKKYREEVRPTERADLVIEIE
ncbi:hypothetical protein EXS54_01905 [Patescibacteria group bacterium]|nr:hypothetical protein [Patescibacteria group bacterium]